MAIEFLNTSKAVELYAKLAIETKGNVETFSRKWKETVEKYSDVVTQDVNEDDILPKKIIGSIEDTLRSDKVFSQFSPVFNIEPGSLIIDPEENADGAWGHKLNAEKKLQTLALQSRDIFPKAIYKLQRLDHMTYLKGGALVAYVLEELPKYVLQRISQAILVGGVKNEDGTDFTAIRPIIGDELAIETQLPADYDGQALKERLIEDIASLDADNPTVFISPAAWAKLALTGDAWSVAMFTGNLDLGGKLVRTTRLPESNPIVIVDTASYLIGFSGSGIETLSDFVINTNSQMIESRAYVAGSLKAPNKAIYTTVASASNG